MKVWQGLLFYALIIWLEFGHILACVISWTEYHSIGWAFGHCFLGWPYIIYWVLEH